MPCSRTGPCRPRICASKRAGGFTLVEVIVLFAVGILLIGLLIPALGASRDRARAIECATRIQQLGVAINLYLNDSAGCLPQVLRDDPAGGPRRVSPLLFGGKRGTLAQDGIDQFGVAERPLNRYAMDSGAAVKPAGAVATEIDIFHSPADHGGTLPSNDGGPTLSMYDRVGTSYLLNDRLLRTSSDEAVTSTLIPLAGGPMPTITTPDRTWLLGSHPIHNFDVGADRRMIWYGGTSVQANLLLADMHVRSLADVPPGPVQSTDTYTFRPTPAPSGQ